MQGWDVGVGIFYSLILLVFSVVKDIKIVGPIKSLKL